MPLTRHVSIDAPRWAVDGCWLPSEFSLGDALASGTELSGLVGDGDAGDSPPAPLAELDHEVWACGVTYRRSRDAREEESEFGAIYDRVHEAGRPEVFFKATGARVVPDGGAIRIRGDSAWNVPEPELVLVVDAKGRIVGYTAGNDVSSRSIEGENPLYLPQAKIYDGSCAMGSSIVPAMAEELDDLPITLTITRAGAAVYEGEASTSQLKRRPQDLVDCLFEELSFPRGAFLFTGTCLVPGDGFSLQSGDTVAIGVGVVRLRNRVD